jgi:hypothetical protein
MKRTSQIALVLMGATAVGTTSYAMMPRDECRPIAGAQQQAGTPTRINPATGLPEAQPCRETRRTWSSSSGAASSSSMTWGRRAQSRTVTSARPAGTSSSGISSPTSTAAARGGFGSTGHAVSSGS